MSSISLVSLGHPPKNRTVPPLSTRWTAFSHASTRPTDSMTKSNRPEYLSQTSLEAGTTSSAPRLAAFSSFSWCGSKTVIWELASRPLTAWRWRRPIGPLPSMATLPDREGSRPRPCTTHDSGSKNAASRKSTYSGILWRFILATRRGILHILA
ncbi:hypothetical protein HRbin01_01908 [archaeon HR01]|nr:hypothetical protein HRbin01_01908 [archaeon HR01]